MIVSLVQDQVRLQIAGSSEPKQVQRDICWQVWDQVADPVWRQVHTQVKNQVWGQVWRQVDDQIYQEVDIW